MDEIDFELELIHRDEDNVAYILSLLAELKNAPKKDQAKKEKQIMDLVAGETELRSKKDLIQKFILNNLPEIKSEENIQTKFDEFWQAETKNALNEMTETEDLNGEKVEAIINNYLFTGTMATDDEIIAGLEKQPSVLQRNSISTRIKDKG